MTNRFSAENAVIGSILIDADCLPLVSSILTSDDFALEANRVLYNAALELSRQGQTVDPVTLRAATHGAVSDEYMIQLMDATATAANAEVYAREARKESMRRALHEVSSRITERTGATDDPREIIGDLQKELERIEAQDTVQELATSGDSFLEFYEHRNLITSGSGGFVPTGFAPLDGILGGGLLNGGLYILAARPGMGKTTFALSIADYMAGSGPVLFVSLEMDNGQLAAKRLARATHIPASRLMMGELNEDEEKRIAQTSKRLSQMPFYLNRKPWATVDDVRSMARKVKGLRCIVIDYFGLLRTPGRPVSRYEAMTEISGQLKALARSLKVPILCLAQLNRENMNRQGKKPMLSDLRDTGALEQDADGVIFLHRPGYYEGDESNPATMQVLVAKNRHAGTGDCWALFFMAESRFMEARKRA